MKVAFIYPGQGSQKVGMGLDLYETQPEFRIAMDQMDPTGRIRELCFNGTARELADTRNTQPCMVACECALTATLYSLGVAPAMLCGLSLGEYSALAAAGVLEARQAVDLAAFRGVEMARAVAGRDCGMAAVLGLDRSSVEQACEEASSAGVVEPTNYNCPGQIVVSGDAAAVTRACELATQAGAKRCVPLPVSGPFHTSLMKPAETPCASGLLASALARCVYRWCSTPPLGSSGTARPWLGCSSSKCSIACTSRTR